MTLIQRVKHNLQIGAPKLRTPYDVLRLDLDSGGQTLPLTLKGGTEDAHVKTVTIRLWVPELDSNGHEAYAIKQQDAHTNNAHGWDLPAGGSRELNPALILPTNLPKTKTLLVTATADIGRDTNNPAVSITLHHLFA